MDITSIFGLVFALFCIISSFLGEGGTLGGLVSVTAAPIIIGGTIGAVCVSLPFEDIKILPRMMKLIFTKKKSNIPKIIDEIVDYAQIARKEGLLALENIAKNATYPIMAKGLGLVVDGVDHTAIKDILEFQLQLEEMEYQKGAKIFQLAGGYSPTMGIIGTVLGLISVLAGGLSNPDELAEKISLAFICTLYGIAFANLFWLPFETKVKVKASKDRFTKELIIEGILSIHAGENPSIIREKLCYQWFSKSNKKGAATEEEGKAYEKK